MKELFNKILRFGVVGGIAFLIDYGVLIFATETLGLYYLLSSALSFSVSTIFNYILSISWVFRVDKSSNPMAHFIVFVILSIIGLAFNQVIMWLCVESLGIHYIIAKVVATLLVMIYNFISRLLILEK